MTNWKVLFDETFASEAATFDLDVRMQLRTMQALLSQYGPHLGRPHADTLKGSKHANMKELRFNAADGVWRVAFAFDPVRTAFLLVAGDKSGMSERRFYKQLVETADRRFDDHLATLAKGD